jgi:hypothetical protein
MVTSVRLKRALPLFLLAVAAIGALSGPALAEPEPEPLVLDAYIACSLSRTAPRAHSCPHASRVGAFLRSSKDVEYEICVRFPTGRELCAASQQARAGVTSVNSVTTSIVGTHRVTWRVDGRRIVRHFRRR